MGSQRFNLGILFAVLYVLHVGYEIFYTLRIERVEVWPYPVAFVVLINAIGFLVWVTSHRWVALANVLIHLVGSLGEARNAFLAGTALRIPPFATHSLMLVVFLLIYLRSE